MKILRVGYILPSRSGVKTNKFAGKEHNVFAGGKSASVLSAALVGLGILAISSISAKNKKLSIEQNAKEVFSEAFIRDDLTDKETTEMIGRYRAIKNIKDDNEYARAMFEEAKNNYGFKDAKIDFSLTDGKIHGNYRTLGNTNPLCGFVQISKNQSRDSIADTIHHEMRHVKQAYLAFNMNPNLYVENLLMSNLIAHKKDKAAIERIMTPDYIRDNVEYMKNRMNLPNPSVKNVPEEKREFALNLLNESLKYVRSDMNHDAYMNTIEEKDAYKTGRLMGGLIKKF